MDSPVECVGVGVEWGSRGLNRSSLSGGAVVGDGCSFGAGLGLAECGKGCCEFGC